MRGRAPAPQRRCDRGDAAHRLSGGARRARPEAAGRSTPPGCLRHGEAQPRGRLATLSRRRGLGTALPGGRRARRAIPAPGPRCRPPGVGCGGGPQRRHPQRASMTGSAEQPARCAGPWAARSARAPDPRRARAHTWRDGGALGARPPLPRAGHAPHAADIGRRAQGGLRTDAALPGRAPAQAKVT